MTAAAPRDRSRGCLLGGAIGDALGAPVEFLSLAEIRISFGPDGIADFAPAYGRIGAITDDTQMTLFTAEGLLCAHADNALGEQRAVLRLLHRSYLRWLLTQGERPRLVTKSVIGSDSWLLGLPALRVRRAPGRTCRSALRLAGGLGDPPVAANDSKGCGGVMRAAPVGLIAPSLPSEDAVFCLAVDAAALTHGHPSGSLPAGYLAVVGAALLSGGSLEQALAAADAQLVQRGGYEETARAIVAARALAERGAPTPEALETLGGGWVGEEALAIAICCALVAEDFCHGVRLAANHSGDSDSTAAIAGNILGALWGEAALPAAWLDRLELRAEIAGLADDLHDAGAGTLSPVDAQRRYLGWQ